MGQIMVFYACCCLHLLNQTKNHSLTLPPGPGRLDSANPFYVVARDYLSLTA
jgi:hypothetical protein